MSRTVNQHSLPSNIGGFTLVEMVVVILIIAVLSGSYALISYQPAPLELTAMAQQLASDIRYTQSLSMTKGVRYRLQSTTSTNYQIVNASGTAITMALGSNTITLGSGISIASATNLPDGLIAFDGWGTPYVDTANTLLTATAVITLIQDSQTQTVSITPGTGRVTVP
jgi:MSHA pilin protein MshC